MVTRTNPVSQSNELDSEETVSADSETVGIEDWGNSGDEEVDISGIGICGTGSGSGFGVGAGAGGIGVVGGGLGLLGGGLGRKLLIETSILDTGPRFPAAS